MQETDFCLTCPRCGGIEFGIVYSPVKWRNGASRNFEARRIFCLDCLDAAERKTTQQPAPPDQRSSEALGDTRSAAQPQDMVSTQEEQQPAEYRVTIKEPNWQAGVCKDSRYLMESNAPDRRQAEKKQGDK